jgi:molybdopterin synthase sulfur carrier subunit
LLKLVFFASLRERLGSDGEILELPEKVTTVGELAAFLAQRGDNWQQVLLSSNVLAAVNQEMCDFSQAVKDGDEVAFFPPVTGG